jgi:hypothetical protein
MGFDAGESWACGNVGKRSQDQIFARLSWITSENAEEINQKLQTLSNSR